MLLQSVLILASALTFATAARAEEEPQKEACIETHCVVAKRGTAVITVADVTAKVKALEPRLQGALLSDPKQINKMLENMLILRQIANEIAPAELEKDPVLQARLKQSYDEVVAVYRLDQIRAERVPKDFEQLARERYLTNMAGMRTPRQVAVRHLLVDFRKYGEAASLSVVQELAAKLAGADQKRFQDMVIEASDDPSKVDNAGLLSLNEESKGVDPDFLAGALALTEPGEISPPIKSQFGYHLIQLIENTPARVVPFEEAKTALIQSLRDEASKRVVIEYRTDLSISGGQVEFYPQNLQGLMAGDDDTTSN
jgi:peptidyl-prolyl cis-trans isomerase C